MTWNWRKTSLFSRNIPAVSDPGGRIIQERQSTSCSCINCDGWGVALTLGIILKIPFSLTLHAHCNACLLIDQEATLTLRHRYYACSK